MTSTELINKLTHVGGSVLVTSVQLKDIFEKIKLDVLEGNFGIIPLGKEFHIFRVGDKKLVLHQKDKNSVISESAIKTLKRFWSEPFGHLMAFRPTKTQLFYRYAVVKLCFEEGMKGKEIVEYLTPYSDKIKIHHITEANTYFYGLEVLNKDNARLERYNLIKEKFKKTLKYENA
jgi:hypothetical protein